MNLKNGLIAYYDVIYRSLKACDRQMQIKPDSFVINLIHEDVIRLDALLSVLLYIDRSVPVIRCQKAFSKLKEDIQGLYYLFREQDFLIKRDLDYFKNNLEKVFDEEIHVHKKKYINSSHQLYFISIHSAEKKISDHLNRMMDTKVNVGFIAYFKNTLQDLGLKKVDTQFLEIGYIVRALLANFDFIAFQYQNKAEIMNQPFYNHLINIVDIVKRLNLIDIILKGLNLNPIKNDKLVDSIRNEFSESLKSLVVEYDGLLRSLNEINLFVISIMGRHINYKESEIHDSISARNSLYYLS